LLINPDISPSITGQTLVEFMFRLEKKIKTFLNVTMNRVGLTSRLENYFSVNQNVN